MPKKCTLWSDIKDVNSLNHRKLDCCAIDMDKYSLTKALTTINLNKNPHIELLLLFQELLLKYQWVVF